MKKWAKYLVTFCLFLSPLFLVLGISGETVEAFCPMGQYWDAANEKCADNPLIKEESESGQLVDYWGNESGGLVQYLFYFVAALSGLSFGIAAIAIVYGGFLYTTSGAYEKNAKKAKIIIMRAGIGIFMSSMVFVFLNIIWKVVLAE